jgi:hypothetical protein
VEGWLENKQTSGWTLDIKPEQVAWAERRRRAGGRIFVAVRRKVEAGPRRGAAVDDLYLFPGDDLRMLFDQGLRRVQPLLLHRGGPALWDWRRIRHVLTGLA